MKHEISSRGFAHLETIVDTYGGEIRVYESSAADEPCVWIAIKQAASFGPTEAHAHITVEQARILRNQLEWLIANHYQTR